jgi:hypothetical protein
VRASIVILVGAATVVNVGLWFWPRPADSPVFGPKNLQIQQCKSDPATIKQPLTPLPDNAVPQKLESHAPAAAVPDQPWVNTVRDSVLQLSLVPKFSDKVLISGLECKGSACEITGSTTQSADGKWHGSSEVADLMKAMGDGQISGGDTDRSVSLNQVHSKPGGNGVDFTLTVQQNNGPPIANPCQSIFDAWKSTHPDDFLENPDHPTIKNYNPPTG